MYFPLSTPPKFESEIPRWRVNTQAIRVPAPQEPSLTIADSLHCRDSFDNRIALVIALCPAFRNCTQSGVLQCLPPKHYYAFTVFADCEYQALPDH